MKYLVSILLFLACASLLQSQTVTVPIALQAQLLMRATKFERNFNEKLSGTPSELVIGILYQKRYRFSARSKTVFEESIRAIKSAYPVRLVAIELEEGMNIPTSTEWENLSILYFTPMRGVDVEEILQKNQKHSVLSCSGVTEYGEKGITITFDLVHDRPKFIINRNSADKENCDFSAQLLNLAIIR